MTYLQHQPQTRAEVTAEWKRTASASLRLAIRSWSASHQNQFRICSMVLKHRTTRSNWSAKYARSLKRRQRSDLATEMRRSACRRLWKAWVQVICSGSIRVLRHPQPHSHRPRRRQLSSGGAGRGLAQPQPHEQPPVSDQLGAAMAVPRGSHLKHFHHLCHLRMARVFVLD